MEKNSAPLKLHYAWMILASCCVMNGASMGIIINCKGLFIAPVCAELNCTVSAFTLYITFYGISAAIALLAVDRVFARWPLRVVLTAAMVMLGLATAAMGIFQSLAAWYAAGIVQGIAGAFLLYVPSPMLINHWFVRHKGMALGIAAAASGVMGALMNPVLSAVIAAEGWRTAYMVQGITACLLAVPFTAFFVVKSPADKGMTAYGAETGGGAENAVSRTKNERGAFKAGHRFGHCICFTSIVTFCAAYAQHFSNHAVSARLGSHFGAWMVSASMVGNILGKAFFGMGSDRWGSRRMCVASLASVMGGFLLLAFGGQNSFAALAGAFLAGIDHANLTVMVPLAVAAISPPEQYDHMISRTTMSTMLTSAFSTMLIGALFDVLASYHAAFFLGALLQVLAIILVLSIFPRREMGRRSDVE